MENYVLPWHGMTLLILLGIFLSFAVIHAILGSSAVDRRTHRLFSVTCACSAGVVLLSYFLHSANTEGAYVGVLLARRCLLYAAICALVLFVSSYAHVWVTWHNAVLGVFPATLTVLALLPTELTLQHVSEFAHVPLPWGELTTSIVIRWKPWFLLLYYLWLAICGAYTMACAISIFRRGHTPQALYLTLVLFLYFGSYLHHLAGWFAVNPIMIAPEDYAFALFIPAASLRLLADFNRTKRLLALQNTRLREAQRLGSIGDWRLDVRTRAFEFSRQIALLFNQDSLHGPIPEERFIAFYPEPMRARVRADLERAVQSRFPYDVEYAIQLPGAPGPVWHRAIVRVETEASGEVRALYGTIQDITREKLAAREQARLSAAMEHSIDYIIMANARGIIEYVSPAFQRALGRSPEDVLGKHVSTLKSGVHPASFYRAMWQTLETGETWRGRLLNQRRDGSLAEFDASISPVLDEFGVVTGYISVQHDVSRESMLEGRLRQVQQLKALGVLTGGLAHDLNNLLSTIFGYTDLMSKRFAADQVERTYADQILRAVSRAASLTTRMLDLSRNKESSRAPHDLRQVVDEVTNLVSAGAPSGIAVKLSLSEGPAMVRCDENQIHQALMNLCINAIHAMEGRSGVLSVKLGTSEGVQEAGVPAVTIQVSDTGCGIPEDVLPRIFEPYFTTRGEGLGSGLGLALIQGIVQSHGGEISVESRVGAGTRFCITLPGDQVETPQDPALDVPAPACTALRAMVVDDQREVLHLMALMLGQLQCEAQCFQTSGPETVDAARHGTFQLALIDFHLPGRNGLELARDLRAACPAMTVVLISGYFAPETRREALAGGFYLLLEKPVGLQELEKLVESLPR